MPRGPAPGPPGYLWTDERALPMSTRDTMELKEETIRAQYEAALGMVFGFDHAPRLAKPLVVSVQAERSPGVGARPTFRSTVPGMATRTRARPGRVRLAGQRQSGRVRVRGRWSARRTRRHLGRAQRRNG